MQQDKYINDANAHQFIVHLSDLIAGGAFHTISK